MSPNRQLQRRDKASEWLAVFMVISLIIARMPNLMTEKLSAILAREKKE
jgi:hypothetical protein